MTLTPMWSVHHNSISTEDAELDNWRKSRRLPASCAVDTIDFDSTNPSLSHQGSLKLNRSLSNVDDLILEGKITPLRERFNKRDAHNDELEVRLIE
jgi:hypothetical protein